MHFKMQHLLLALSYCQGTRQAAFFAARYTHPEELSPPQQHNCGAQCIPRHRSAALLLQLIHAITWVLTMQVGTLSCCGAGQRVVCHGLS